MVSEKTILELIEAVKLCHERCPWTKEQKLEDYYRYVLSEMFELDEALKGKDYSGLSDELGDILWGILTIAHIAEEQGHLTVDGVMKHTVEKMKRRKPYIFEGRKVTVEEAKRIWQE